MNRAISGLMLLLGLGTAFVVPTVRADAERGRLLYENHCQGCHLSTVHVREQRKVVTPAELRAAILRWSGEIKMSWQESERADVYQYLNNQYYRFPVAAPSK